MIWSRNKIDEAYARFSENLTAFGDLTGTFMDETGEQGVHATRIEVETPVEMDVCVQDDGSIFLGFAPPLYRIETSILPVFHTLHLTLEPRRRLRGGEP